MLTKDRGGHKCIFVLLFEVRYAAGGGLFLHLSLEEAEEKLEKRTSEVQEELKGTEASMTDIAGRMEELKATLYAKFGSTINLEA